MVSVFRRLLLFGDGFQIAGEVGIVWRLAVFYFFEIKTPLYAVNTINDSNIPLTMNGAWREDDNTLQESKRLFKPSISQRSGAPLFSEEP